MTTDIEKSPNPEDNGERAAISDSSSSACSKPCREYGIEIAKGGIIMLPIVWCVLNTFDGWDTEMLQINATFAAAAVIFAYGRIRVWDLSS